MSSDLIPELNTPFVFRERPEAIPGDLRPLWRIGILLLMLHIASRGAKSSFGRLHVLNWALRSKEGREALLDILNGRLFPGTVVVRIEPSLNRAVDLANGEGLVRRVHGNRIELTARGQNEAAKIMKHAGIFESERAYLKRVGKRVTEKLVTELFGGQI
jgi:hypothetical protein